MGEIIKHMKSIGDVALFQRDSSKSRGVNGFTLIELMLVLVLIAIFMVIAIPSYQEYVRRADASAVQQEMQKIAEQLARHKAKNFTYRGFDPAYIYGALYCLRGQQERQSNIQLRFVMQMIQLSY